ncbi:outer membrane lipoprotein carrier protein LolA [Leeia sp. TBRC 13508]|uniref:Outer membrane lipoprotein carrier protein LolA n=1 Tax=Leeia speluncae TaxID=2884804 RepID=A0ABS8D3X8_9NEIS|nr:LolA-related protein [Leeia speluncae]MCB6182909.1 outer membrane lipoprotein carrier protein LolA [Leeia speluncae]
MQQMRKLSVVTRACVGISLLVAAATSMAAEWGVNDLMQSLSQKKAGTATFVEKKFISTLNQPLESTGQLAFTAPDRLEKRTLSPAAESMILQGDKLMVERADGKKLNVSLSDRPEVSAFVESIRATLAGDKAGLEKYYAIVLNGKPEQWQISLTPTQSKMQKVISQIRIQGTKTQIKMITFLQADGDRSEMTITETSSK